MNNRYQLHDRNYLLKYTCRTSRDPDKQRFDNNDYDIDNEFTNLKIVYLYRETGERVMQQNQAS